MLWPADEPWPVCMKRDPDLLTRLEAGLARGEDQELDIDARTPEMPSLRETALLLIDKCRNGHGSAYLPVLQLTRAEFPELPFPGKADLLQLLWCPQVHFEGSSGFQLLFRRSGSVKSLRTDRPPTTDGYAISPCVLDPEPLPDYPSWLEMDPSPVDLLSSESDWSQILADFGPAPGTKLFGSPRWEQNADYPHCSRCTKRMHLLVTISSSEFGNGRHGHLRWVPIEDRDVLRGAPFALRQKYELPHEWMIGDGGDAYLFYCRSCPGEFDSRVQCG
ncbi:hypothetical protein [uncultured Paludibaculum sp.]|uniref:hypothetical protein n=1 Tax=uncultured Paludibaculum sp. TaxID=1765020 RepID=UPI002AAAD160|nr:hypothetical protein [uncultured Paludibaculum sp.]